MKPNLYLAGAAIIFSSCVAAPPAPIVDMEGVNQATYNKDLAYCYQHQPFIAAGNPITTCMKEKGYKVLFSN